MCILFKFIKWSARRHSTHHTPVGSQCLPQRFCRSSACLFPEMNQNTERGLVDTSARLKVSCVTCKESCSLNEKTAKRSCADAWARVSSTPAGGSRAWASAWPWALAAVNALLRFHSSSLVRFFINAFCRLTLKLHHLIHNLILTTFLPFTAYQWH